jgi:hypothetical protein
MKCIGRSLADKSPKRLYEKAKTTVQGQSAISANMMECGGVRWKVNSGTIEVRFMIDPKRRRELNLCLRLRQFIAAARVLDPIFSIPPLSEDRGENITKAEEWPHTKEGINK